MTEIEMSVGDARQAFSELVNRARYSDQVTVVTNRERPVAVIVPVSWYQAAKTAMEKETPSDHTKRKR